MSTPMNASLPSTTATTKPSPEALIYASVALPLRSLTARQVIALNMCFLDGQSAIDLPFYEAIQSLCKPDGTPLHSEVVNAVMFFADKIIEGNDAR